MQGFGVMSLACNICEARAEWRVLVVLNSLVVGGIVVCKCSFSAEFCSSLPQSLSTL